MSRRALLSAALALALAGCAALGGLITDLGVERPPPALTEATLASDARLLPSGALAGSFVGEGTSRAVHLVSSDTALIGALARRVHPGDPRRDNLWSWLDQQGTVVVPLDARRDSALLQQPALAGSPAGLTPVQLQAMVLHGAGCGGRGPQAELIVGDAGQGQGPSLRGPVIAAFFAPDDYRAFLNRAWRDPIPPPDPALQDSLLRWTRFALDSLAARDAPPGSLPLQPDSTGPLDINGLADDDAADVQPYRTDDGRTRYAVSLRIRRRTADGAPLLAAIVIAWDATGAWRQEIFRPTLLEFRRGRPARAHGGGRSIFWRRLQPVSGFVDGRDYLWMEQVEVTSGQVLWVMLDPRDNTVVAAAAMDGPC